MGNKLNITTSGMFLDKVFWQREQGALSWALNANIQSFDGNVLTYTNEPSNQLCNTFPPGFIVIGTRLILSRNEVIFALVNPITGDSKLSRITNINCNSLTADNAEYNCSCVKGSKLTSNVKTIAPCCVESSIVDNKCLNFNIDHPVRMIDKQTNCGYKLYLDDDFNPPRYIDLDVPNGIDDCNKPYDSFSCDRIKIFKDFCSPDLEAISIEPNGNLQAGSYQALIAYCDIHGQEFTDYFQATNPVSIFQRTLTVDTDYYVNKSIKFKISHNTDIFDFFKLAIIKTVNETSQYLEQGIHRVSSTDFVIYTGNELSPIITSLEKLITPSPSYTKAKFIAESSDHLIHADLEGDPEYNFQPFVNKLSLYWETVKIPYNTKNNFSNPIIASRFQPYMRDEVYPMGIRFKLKNGKKTSAFHIPNWKMGDGTLRGPDGMGDGNDLTPIPIDNQDNINDDNCNPNSLKPRWKVYNTGTNKGAVPVYTPTKDERICDVERYEYGDFSYWESTETYPCDKKIWGDLAGKFIRYHKFPDSVLTHIHDSYTGTLDINHQSFIMPIGVRLNEPTFNSWLSMVIHEDLTVEELICGFEIVRGNRVGHKSIVAKGLLYDAGTVVEKSGAMRKYYYANYPYNDLGYDSFLSDNDVIYDSPDPGQTVELQNRLKGFETSSRQRFTFHGPDVHFQQPTLGNILKLETEEYGMQEGHFVQVKNHPRYKFLTKFDSSLATFFGTLASTKSEVSTETVAFPTSVNQTSLVSVDYSQLIGVANTITDMLEQLIPYRNFAYQFNSRGVYNNYIPIPNEEYVPQILKKGGKIRPLEIAKYLSPNNQNVGDDAPIHNYNRESSVYLKTPLRYREYVNEDPSRYTLGRNPFGRDLCSSPETVLGTPIRSFYGSIKNTVPDQYGNIDNIRYVSTGYQVTLEGGEYKRTFYPAFGGDVFINQFSLKRKMPFWTQNMVGRPDGISFDYDLVPNIAFPTYYIGTSPDELALNEIFTVTDAGVITLAVGVLLASSLIPPPASSIAIKIANTALTIEAARLYARILSAFIPKNNLDCDTTPANINGISDFSKGNTIFYQSGKFYLASYGIPTFFVESDVNLELRHGTNPLEENFYPNVGQGIPDEWLQEANVPILHDNKYHYNATYSIQNSQNYIISFNNYNFDKLCQSDFPNRLIYSEKANNEQNYDNWLKYKANNYYDFDKSLGRITGIDTLDNNKILVRFENTFQLFNTRITLESNSPYQVAISNSGMFTEEPIEYSKTNTGNAGSQHIAFEQTPHGSFWVDAKRGEVYQFNDKSLNEISRTNYNWFKEHLPFRIIKDFPDYDVDNAFKAIGIAICWDERGERLFITKRDYELLPEWKKDVDYNFGVFTRVINGIGTVISLEDPIYFANKSFTVAWSPLINNWVSFYSFLPNYYVSHPTHFQSGIHNSIWNHNLSNLSYQTYYNTLYPYIIELPISNLPQAEILKSVTINTDIQKYSSESDFYSLKSTNKENYNIFFNKAIIYNKEQSSGLLTLTEMPINNMRARFSYPIYNIDNINILYSKYGKVCTFNTFYDITKNYENQQPIFTTDWNQLQASYPMDKALNIDNANYRNTNKKIPIRSNECYVRLIQDVHSRYKFTNVFEIMQQEESKNPVYRKP